MFPNPTYSVLCDEKPIVSIKLQQVSEQKELLWARESLYELLCDTSKSIFTAEMNKTHMSFPDKFMQNDYAMTIIFRHVA